MLSNCSTMYNVDLRIDSYTSVYRIIGSWDRNLSNCTASCSSWEFDNKIRVFIFTQLQCYVLQGECEGRSSDNRVRLVPLVMGAFLSYVSLWKLNIVKQMSKLCLRVNLASMVGYGGWAWDQIQPGAIILIRIQWYIGTFGKTFYRFFFSNHIVVFWQI